MSTAHFAPHDQPDIYRALGQLAASVEYFTEHVHSLIDRVNALENRTSSLDRLDRRVNELECEKPPACSGANAPAEVFSQTWQELAEEGSRELVTANTRIATLQNMVRNQAQTIGTQREQISTLEDRHTNGGWSR